MSRSRLRAFGALVATAVGLAAPSSASADYEVGTAVRDIDPSAAEIATGRVFLGGYGITEHTSRAATGLLGEGSSVRAFAVRSGAGQAFAIANMEVQGWFVATKDGPYGIVDMRREVESRTNGALRAEQVFVQSDHSHSGLDTMGVWGGVPLTVRQRVFDETVDAIVAAFESRQPGDLFYGEADAPELLNNQYEGDPNNPDLDTAVRVLQARDAGGVPFATLMNFSAHTTVLGSGNTKVSGDWVQKANPLLEQAFGGGAVTIVGTLGRSQPKRDASSALCNTETNADAKALCQIEKYAAQVVAKAVTAVAGADEITGDPVVAARSYLIQDAADNPVLLGLSGPGDVVGAPLNRSLLPPWLTGNVIGTSVGTARIGDVLIASMPGEAYPQIPAKVREIVAGDARAVMTSGLSNDQLGYLIAPAEAYGQPICRTIFDSCETDDVPGVEPISNDNYAFNVSKTMGERVTCGLLRGAGGVLKDDEAVYRDQYDRCAAFANDLAFGSGSDTLSAGDATEGDPLAEAGVAQYDYTGGEADGPVKAGVGVVDASWRVGSTAGQYADIRTTPEEFGGPEDTESDIRDGTQDPHGFSTFKTRSYGTQSRLEVRAIVTEDADGNRIALLKNDLYIPQDLIIRRTAQLLADRDVGITQENLTMAVSHNHSSPYHSSTGAGAWTFQDVYDGRFFEEYARLMADAVEEAATHLKPVRIGAAVGSLDKPHRHSFGPQIADDGTPAGYPQSDAEHDLIAIRYDDMTDPEDPKPLAVVVNWSLHPEMLDGNHLISGDYLAPLQRMVDRATGATTIFTQNAVGTAEPERSTYHPHSERLEFSHREYGQAEYAARLIADETIATWKRVETDPDVPFRTSLEVGMVDRWYPGPASHPYPGVSNCKTSAALEGRPLLPVAGLPDCQNADQVGVLEPIADAFNTNAPFRPDNPPFDPGVPIPSNYSAPSYGALQESFDVHLQAFRLGDILFTVCSCEQWTDQARNIQSRTNAAQDDMYLGYDWSARYAKRPDGKWEGPDPRNEAQTLVVEEFEYQRMRAQVNNDAAGWDFLEYAPYAESEPDDPAEIKGNYTHEELPPDLGYDLTVPIAMANDYNGYIATYREYQRGDHYRKALTAWGPHSSDYLATRLVQLGGHLKQRDTYVLPTEAERELADSAARPKVEADLAANEAKAEALGASAQGEVAAYEATLPDDAGTPGPVEQPVDVQRFDATHFTWIGGSNYVDHPDVRVEREVSPGVWAPYADGSGEVPFRVRFPDGPEEQAQYRAGEFEWHWTASFEAFVAGQFKEDSAASPATFDPGERPVATPPGTYRFAVLGGKRRTGGAFVPYEVRSAPFTVSPWHGITAQDIELEDDGTVSVDIGPTRGRTAPATGAHPPLPTPPLGDIDYPDSYDDSPFPFIEPAADALRAPGAPLDADRVEWFCFECSFRPWIDAGEAETVTVTITRADGTTEEVEATRREDGRYATSRALAPGESAQVAAGDVLDRFGNDNGAPSGTVGIPAPDDGDDGDGGGDRPGTGGGGGGGGDLTPPPGTGPGAPADPPGPGPGSRPPGSGAGASQGGGTCSDVRGLRTAGVRVRGRGALLAFTRRVDAPVTVDVFQSSIGRRVVRERLVARFTARSRSVAWDGRANRPGRRVRDGLLFVRFTMRLPGGAVDIRRVVLLRKRGRLSIRRPHHTPDPCGLVRSFKLERPAFGGRGARPLGVSFRLRRDARVRITVSRGRRVVRRLVDGTRRGGVMHRLRVRARSLPRGEYRITLTAVAGRERMTRTLVSRRV